MLNLGWANRGNNTLESLIIFFLFNTYYLSINSSSLNDFILINSSSLNGLHLSLPTFVVTHIRNESQFAGGSGNQH